MGNQITIQTSEQGKFAIVKVGGKIDADGAPALTSELNKLVGAGKVFIVVDLADVNFMSSAGIGVTVKALNDTRSKKGDLRLAGIQSDVKKVYELLGFAAAFQFYKSVSEATSA